MKDARVKFYQVALDRLVEALEATVRVDRWDDPAEPAPDALRGVASEIVERLGAAGRLANGTFVGTPNDVAKVNTIRAAMVRLDEAYVAYRQVGGSERARSGAATLLESEVAQIRAKVLTS